MHLIPITRYCGCEICCTLLLMQMVMPDDHLKSQHMMNHHALPQCSLLSSECTTQLCPDDFHSHNYQNLLIAEVFAGNKSFLIGGKQHRSYVSKLVHETIESGIGFLCFSLQLSPGSSGWTGAIKTFRHGIKSRDKNVFLKNHWIQWTTASVW